MQFYILIALVTFLWGLSFPTMKIGLSAMSPFTFLLFRSLVSSATIFGLILLKRGALKPPPGRPEGARSNRQEARATASARVVRMRGTETMCRPDDNGESDDTVRR